MARFGTLFWAALGITCGGSERERHASLLLDWCQSNGAATSVEPFWTGGRGVGVRATLTIEPGDAILHIPWSLCIDPMRARHALDALPEVHALEAHAVLIVWLMRERLNHSSPWVQLLRALPASFDHALGWTAHTWAVVATQYPSLAKHVEETMVHPLMGLFFFLERTVFTNATCFPPDDDLESSFRWASGVVLSRFFGRGEHVYLCPILDLLNFRSRAKHRIARPDFAALATSDAETYVTLVSAEHYDAGEEVFYEYTDERKCHLEILAFWGFAPDSVAHDCLHLDLSDGIPPDWRRDFLYAHVSPILSFAIHDIHANLPARSGPFKTVWDVALASARVIQLNETDRSLIERPAVLLELLAAGHISSANELAMWSWMRSRLAVVSLCGASSADTVDDDTAGPVGSQAQRILLGLRVVKDGCTRVQSQLAALVEVELRRWNSPK